MVNKASKIKIITKTKKVRKSRSDRKFIRRLKQEARKTGVEIKLP